MDQQPDEDRMTRLENSVAGVRTGQTVMRDQIDQSITELKALIELQNTSQPLGLAVWVLIMLASTQLVLVGVALVIVVDYYITP